MTWEVAGICLFIFVARIVDVSLGTIRTLCIVYGRAGLAWALGFFEVLVWIFAVGQVIDNLEKPVYALAYAIGFATGNYVGIHIERRLAYGRQVVRIFTRLNRQMVATFRELGYRVTEFEGHGRDGVVGMLFIETTRREMPKVLRSASKADPRCYYIVDDVRMASKPSILPQPSTGWAALFKRK